MTGPTVVLICVKLALQILITSHAFTSVFTPTLAIQNLQHEIALNFPITLQQSPPPPKFAKPRHYQKSSWDLVLFCLLSDRTSSTGIWITLYQIHYLRSIDLDIFTRMTIPISDFNQRTGFEHLTFRLRGKRPINCVTTEVNRTCMLIVITKRPWLGRRKMKCNVKASMLSPLNRSVMMVVTYQIFLYHTTGVSFVLLENNWS